VGASISYHTHIYRDSRLARISKSSCLFITATFINC
jgi:hypothetical protein